MRKRMLLILGTLSVLAGVVYVAPVRAEQTQCELAVRGSWEIWVTPEGSFPKCYGNPNNCCRF